MEISVLTGGGEGRRDHLYRNLDLCLCPRPIALRQRQVKVRSLSGFCFGIFFFFYVSGPHLDAFRCYRKRVNCWPTDRRQLCFIGWFSLLASKHREELQEFWKLKLQNWIGKALGPHQSSTKSPHFHNNYRHFCSLQEASCIETFPEHLNSANRGLISLVQVEVPESREGDSLGEDLGPHGPCLPVAWLG